MTQNIYDRQEFFEGYKSLTRSQHGLSPLGAPEWPVLCSYIPSLKDKSLLDLGCGMGWYCRWAEEQSATLVQGIDVSTNMLETAKRMTESTIISYEQADLENIVLQRDKYDVVFSSLVLHYISDLGGLMEKIHYSLKTGGAFVFSVEHPTVSAPLSADPKWMVDENEQKIWPLSGYLNEGKRRKDWFMKGVIRYHRTIGRYVKLLIDAGFVLRAIDEWGPTLEQLQSGECSWPNARERPPYLLVKAVKSETSA